MTRRIGSMFLVALVAVVALVASGVLEKLGYEPLPEYEEPTWSPVSDPELAKQYPLVLTSGASSAYYYRSHQKMLDKMRRQHPYPVLQIHPETADRLGVHSESMSSTSSYRTAVWRTNWVEGLHSCWT